MKTYRRHRCERQHRTWQTFAKCRWPRAARVIGNGPYASVAYCGRGSGRPSQTITVMLFGQLDDAEKAKGWIDDTGCGGGCTGRHEIIRLVGVS